MTDQPTGLTPEQIAEIRERCEQATPGPWIVVDRRDVDNGDEWLVMMDGGREDSSLLVKWDAEFIAHARMDVPALLATVDALTARVRELEQEHEAALFQMREATAKGQHQFTRAERAEAQLTALTAQHARLRELLIDIARRWYSEAAQQRYQNEFLCAPGANLSRCADDIHAALATECERLRDELTTDLAALTAQHARLREALTYLVSHDVRWADDQGPPGEGWQSAALMRAWHTIEDWLRDTTPPTPETT